MPKALSSRRYAQAVFRIATESGELDKWTQDLDVMSTAIQSQDLLTFLDAPQVPTAAKTNIINQTFASSIGPLALNLALLLGSRSMAGSIPEIAKEYSRMLDVHREIKRGEVIAAMPLNDEQQTKIAEMLEVIVDSKVQMTTRVEPDVIGGLIAQIGDKVIDGSLRTRLDRMRRSIVNQM